MTFGFGGEKHLTQFNLIYEYLIQCFLYKSVGHVILETTFECISEFSHYSSFSFESGERKQWLGGEKSEIFIGSYSAFSVFLQPILSISSLKNLY